MTKIYQNMWKYIEKRQKNISKLETEKECVFFCNVIIVIDTKIEILYFAKVLFKQKFIFVQSKTNSYIFLYLYKYIKWQIYDNIPNIPKI